MERTFSVEEIRMLAECEHMMDAGEYPFVVAHGQRMMVNPLVMEELGLETGQTVNHQIIRAISRAHLGNVEAQIAASKLSQ